MAEEQYILDFTFNLIECTCRVSLTSTPDKPTVDKIYLFFEIGNISVQRYHKPESDTLGDFYGFETKKLTDKRAEFKIDTGDSFVIFEARTKYDILNSLKEADDSEVIKMEINDAE